MIRLVVDLPRNFSRHFRAFRRYTGRHMYALALLTLLMSWAEAIGLALFFPLLKGGTDHSDPLSSAFTTILDALGVEPSPTAVLPLIVAAFVFKGILTYVTYAYQAWLAARIPLQLRREIVDGLRKVDYRAIDSTNTGTLANLLVNEVNKVDYGFISFVRCFAPAVNVIVFFALVLWLDIKLTLLCGLMALIAIALVGLTGRIAMIASRQLTRESAFLSSLLIQVVHAFKYLRATAGFGPFVSKIGDSAERAANAEYKSNSIGALSQSLSQPLMVMFLAGIVYYHAAIQGQPLGSLFVLLIYFFRIMNELWALQTNWQSFMSYVGPIELVYSSLASFSEQVEKSGDRPFALTQEIRLRDVSFAYLPGKPVLRDVSLTIPRNTTIAFVGESGSGKTTLVDVIAGTLKPSDGTVSYDGVSLSDIDLESLRREIGFVAQDTTLFDDTVGNNITLWQQADDAKVWSAARRAKSFEFIQAMGEKLDTQIGDRGIKLSGGQRQRIAIARELFKEPEILILDEATSALDTESERAIQQSIDELAGQMTILIIAHRLSTIRNCQRICVLHEGRIVETGSYNELVARPDSRFAKLVQLQELSRETAEPTREA